MAINKIITRVDGFIEEEIDFERVISGLSAGSHTIEVQAFDGNTLINSDSKNITISSGSSFDPDYQAVLDYATDNSIPLPSTTQQNIDNQFMIDYKATGAWDRDDIVLKLQGSADPAFKRIDWKRLILVDFLGSTSWDNNGLIGNGTNVYVDIKYNPSIDAVNYALEDASFTWYNQTVGEGIISGWYNGSNNEDYSLIRKNDDEISFDIHSSYNETSNTTIWHSGLMGAYRTGGIEYLIGNGEISINEAAGIITNGNIYLMARNSAGSENGYYGGQIGFFSLGASKRDIHSDIAAIF